MTKHASARDAYDEWRRWLETQDLADSTVRTYTVAIRKLVDLHEVRQRERRLSASVAQLGQDAITDWYGSYGTPKMRNWLINPLRSWCTWAVRTGHMTAEQSTVLLGSRRLAKTHKRQLLYVPADRFGEMLDIAEERHPRDRAAIAVGLFTLCRISEVGNIALSRIDLRANEIRVWRRKLQRWTTEVMDIDLRAELDYWLSWYASHMGCSSPAAMISEHPDWLLIPHLRAVRRREGSLFAAATEFELCPTVAPKCAEMIVKRPLAIMGYEGEQGKTRGLLGEGVHTLRRSGARALLKVRSAEPSIGPARALLQVSKKLDHDNIRTTMTYLGLDEERDLLNEHLRNNQMFGDIGITRGRRTANVVPLRGAVSAAQATAEPGPAHGLAMRSTAL